MATRVIDDTKLNDIAAAIQAKDNGGQMTVDEMPGRIQAIPSGGDPNANFDAYIKRTQTTFSTTATSIPMYCFYENDSITNISMPNVTSIGTYAFSYCENLALTSLPSGLTSIGASAFSYCKNLALTSLPSGLTSIGASAFSYCENLALTSLPSGITSIEQYAFSSCKRLALTSLPSGITSIGRYAFQNCKSIQYFDLSGLDGVPSLINSNAFVSTTFPFYFRDQTQLDQFAAATNWSSLASRFQIKPA